MDEGDFALCQVILQHADLSDLLFFQHVINQEKISKDANPLFQDFILLATDAKKTMHIPLVYQTRTAAGALGILSLFTQSKLGILAAVLTFVFADEIQNWRISHSLENKLALKKIGGEMPVVEDGFDNIQKGVTHVAKEGFNSAVNFFKNQVFSNLTMPEENKHVASPKGM